MPTVATRAKVMPLQGKPRGDLQVVKSAKYPVDLKWLKGRIKDMEQERDRWSPQWREIAQFISPGRSHFLTQDYVDGRKRKTKILNGKATRSVRRAVAGFQTGMTPRTRPWFIFETENSRLEGQGAFEERTWADASRSIVASILQRSNFYSSTLLVYEDAIPYGSGAMQIDEVDDFTLINTIAHPIGSYLIDTNDMGVVDTFARPYRWTLKKVINRFGKNALSPTMQKQSETSIGAKVTCWNMIFPNGDFKKGAIGPAGKAFLSCWWIEGEEDTHGPVHVDGYHEFPVFVLRFWKVADEAWGQSPGMDALPDVKALQKVTSLKLLGIEKSVLPPLKGPGSRKDSPSRTPGSYTAVSGPQDQVTNLEDDRFELTPILNEIEQLKFDIADTFFEPLFSAIMDTARRQRTLGEVEKIESEKYALLGPVLENIIDDLLEPAITRVYKIAERRGKIPEPPESVTGVPVQIGFVSILAQAQKALEAVGVEQLMAFVGNLSEQFPHMRNRINQDAAIERYADAVAAAPILTSREEAAEMAQAEAAAQRQQEQLMMLESMARSAKDASAAQTETPSALSAIADQFAGGRA